MLKRSDTSPAYQRRNATGQGLGRYHASAEALPSLHSNPVSEGYKGRKSKEEKQLT